MCNRLTVIFQSCFRNGLKVLVLLLWVSLAINPLRAVASSTEEVYLEAIRLLRSYFYDTQLASRLTSVQLIEACRPLNHKQLYKAIDCLLLELNDPNTKILTPQETKQEQSRINNQRSAGFGIVLDPIDPRYILQVLSGSPAEAAGIKAGDQIQAIDNVPIGYLKNDEIKGFLETPVELSRLSLDLKRGNYTHLSKQLEAKPVKVVSIKTKIMANDIAYLRVVDFLSTDFKEDFKRALKDPQIQRSKGLIIDLKGNAGGLLENGIDFADAFLGKGMAIIQYVRRGEPRQVVFSDEEMLYHRPIVVIIDESTASSAEVVAAALKENKRAYVIGKSSFGKGSIQRIKFLPDHSSLHITTSKFYTPSGQEINFVGIQPHLIIEDSYTQLKSALEHLKK